MADKATPKGDSPESEAPAAPAFSFNVTPETIDGVVTAVEQIDSQITPIVGNMADVLKKGREAVQAESVRPYFADGDEGAVAFSIPSDLTLGDYLATVRLHLQEAENFGNEVLNQYIRDHSTGSDTLEALRTQRAALVTQHEAYLNIVSQIAPAIVPTLKSMPDAPAMPKSRTGSGSGTSNSKTPKTTARFYRLRSGVRDWQSDLQHSMSSMAYVNFHTTVDVLRAALAKQNGGHPVDETVAGEYTVTIPADQTREHIAKPGSGKEWTWTFGWEPMAD
jgi:hypothetical protein